MVSASISVQLLSRGGPGMLGVRSDQTNDQTRHPLVKQTGALTREPDHGSLRGGIREHASISFLASDRRDVHDPAIILLLHRRENRFAPTLDAANGIRACMPGKWSGDRPDVVVKVTRASCAHDSLGYARGLRRGPT